MEGEGREGKGGRGREGNRKERRGDWGRETKDYQNCVFTCRALDGLIPHFIYAPPKGDSRDFTELSREKGQSLGPSYAN